MSPVPPRDLSWREIEIFLKARLAEWRDQCRTPMAPFDETPTEEMDAACDYWCRYYFFSSLGEEKLPPDKLRSWLIARAVMAAVAAATLALNGHPSPGQFDQALMEEMFIHRWHAEYRVRWNLMMLHGNDPDGTGS